MSLLLLFHNGLTQQQAEAPAQQAAADFSPTPDLGSNFLSTLSYNRAQPRRDEWISSLLRRAPAAPPGILTLNIDDLLAILDNYTKANQSVMGDAVEYQDAVIKAINAVQNDSVSADDIASIVRFLVLLVMDSEDAFDVDVKSLAASMAEFLTAADELAKIQSSEAGDSLVGQDAFTKNLLLEKADSADLFDQSMISRLLDRLFSDPVDVFDDQTKSISSQTADAMLSADAISKSIFATKDDNVDVSDTVDLTKVIALVLLELLDAIDIFDGFFKTIGKVESENNIQSDAFVKNLLANRDDWVDISEAINASRSSVLALLDAIDVADDFFKRLNKIESDSQLPESAIVKSITANRDDTVDVSDTLETSRTIALILMEVLDALDVADEFFKKISKLETDNDVQADALVKSLSMNKDDAVYVSDSVDLTRVIALILLELADLFSVADDFLKTLHKDETESYSTEDAVIKVLAKITEDKLDILESIVKSILANIGDSQQADDGLTKSIFKVLVDSMDVADALLVTRTLSTLFADTVAVLDEYAKIQSVALPELAFSEDAFVKAVSKVADDQFDISDAATVAKFVALVLTDFLHLMDEYIRAQSANVDERSVGEDAVVKLLSKTMADDVSFSDDFDVQKVIALILVEISDLLLVADDLLKTFSTVIGDTSSPDDAIVKLIQKVASDSADVSDASSVNRALSLAVDDLVSVLDGLAVMRQFVMDESAVTSEEFVKTVTQTVAELLDARDELNKLQSIALADSTDIFDIVTTLRTMTLLVNDAVEAIESIVKALSAIADEPLDHVDNFIKVLLKSVHDQLEIFDEAVLVRIVSLVLDEIQPITDDMVKAVQVEMDDETLGVDALVKLIVKVMPDDVVISDDLTMGIIRAIIIIAEYLDTRLSATRDLSRRLGTEDDLRQRVSKILETSPRKPGTKGHVR